MDHFKIEAGRYVGVLNGIFCEDYWGSVQFKEDDIFRTVIPLKEESKIVIGDEVFVTGDKPAITGDKPPINADKTPINMEIIDDTNIEESIVRYLENNEFITNKIVQKLFDLKDTKSKVILRTLVSKDILIAEGANRNRRYKLNK